VPTRAGVLARTDLGTFQIAGSDAGGFAARVAPLLDGSCDADGIAAALGEYSAKSVRALLAALSARGLVEEVPDPRTAPPRRGQGELFRKLSLDPAAAAGSLSQARVIVIDRGPCGEAIAAELTAAGVGEIRVQDAIADEEAPFDLLVATLTEATEIDRASRLAHAAGAMSLWACLDGVKAQLGPLVVPGMTACRVCAGAGALNPPLGLRPPEPSPAMEGLLAHLAATEAVAVLAGIGPSLLGGRVSTLDLVTFEPAFHTLVRIPWCAVCGSGH
jgi:hypothetical protein